MRSEQRRWKLANPVFYTPCSLLQQVRMYPTSYQSLCDYATLQRLAYVVLGKRSGLDRELGRKFATPSPDDGPLHPKFAFDRTYPRRPQPPSSASPDVAKLVLECLTMMTTTAADTRYRWTTPGSGATMLDQTHLRVSVEGRGIIG